MTPIDLIAVVRSAIAVITPAEIVAVVITFIAAVTDIRTGKVPNWLTFNGAAAGILCQWWQWRGKGMEGLIWGVQGWFLALAIMLGTRALAVMVPGGLKRSSPVGFGDIKLMAAVGACLGPGKFLCQFFLFAVLFGGFGVVKIAAVIPWKLLKPVLSGLPGNSLMTQDEKDRLFRTMKTSITLAPFIAVATIGSILLYSPLLNFIRGGN